ncbi:MAG: hypothetical protein RLZZ301_370 [Bacteroidota bacterium]
MIRTILSLLMLATIGSPLVAQKEIPVQAPLEKVTVFFTGAQLEHVQKINLQPGKQELVFQKLTDFIDPNTVQVKANGNLTILSVHTRKNYEDERISASNMDKLNQERKRLENRDVILRDEYAILNLDKTLLLRNSDLKGNEQGVKIAELKEAYAFMHTKLTEISARQAQIQTELEDIFKQLNKLEQEITSQRSKPVVNYSEIVVEIDVKTETNAVFTLNYISPKATWKPYYDMRSDGIGKAVRLEAKALVSQQTGINWTDVNMVLSTNDPYDNKEEPKLEPWNIYYNNQAVRKPVPTHNIPSVSFEGQKIHGEVIDASTGEPLPFTKISFNSNPQLGAITNFEGKFEVLVPKGETALSANYIGYFGQEKAITAAYLKFFLVPQKMELEEVIGVDMTFGEAVAYDEIGDASASTYGFAATDKLSETSVMKLERKSIGRKGKMLFAYSEDDRADQSAAWGNAIAQTQEKDLRIDYQIVSKMSIPTDGFEHRVPIAEYDLNTSYEYHLIPKLDQNVYLSAQISGWEKLKLMSGASNIYFDGTYMGASYLDVNSIKDTISVSFGIEKRISVERNRIKEKSKSKTIGSRERFEVAWEITLKNNGAAAIPVIIKDQFPISNLDDIKVKQGSITGGGVLDEKTAIITWYFPKGFTGTQVLGFDYYVDYSSGYRLILE